MEVVQETPGPKLWLVLARAYRSVADFIESSIDSLGIGLSDFMILEALLHKGPLTMSVIAEKVLLANASMTSAVDRLEERGLVHRKADENDRRVRMVELTPEGETMIKTIYAQHEADIESVMGVLSQCERASLRAMLKKIGFAARDEAAKDCPRKNGKGAAA